MYQRILVPLDGSDTAAAGLEEAIKLARLTGATLVLLHVVEITHHVTGFEPYEVFAHDAVPAMQRAGSDVLDLARVHVSDAGVPVETQLLATFATPVWELVIAQAEAKRADLIVLGTHGRRGLDRVLLGSNAEQVLRLARVPVLLVPHGGRAPADNCGETKPSEPLS